VAVPFKGAINIDIRDSKPDWAPFEPPQAPPGTPNVLYIVLDDVGFAALSCYGGPIETPNIERIAAAGARYTQWHTTSLCSPTRSCLLTGRNHTRNSMACITEAAIGFPNASGTIPPENGMLSEILAERGWNTYMVGKWHLCPTDEMNLAATRRNWPSGRGFERSYGFLGAETNQWYPDLIHDNHPVDQPRTPDEGYHLTDDITDKALEFIKDGKAIAPDKPFFTLTLYHADRKVGTARIKTQLGAFAVAGASLYIGRHGGEPVTGDFPGPAPYHFTGGTLRQVNINVSGKPYLDLEREAVLMLMRE
jgi:arylsulfatase